MKQVLIGLCGAVIALVIVGVIAMTMPQEVKHVPAVVVKPVEVPVTVAPSSVVSEQVQNVTTPRSVD